MELERIPLNSMDISATNREKLKQLFPTVFVETTDEQGKVVESVDFEKLKAELGTFTDLFESRRERYGIDWPGKKDAMKIIQQPSVATLKPSREESVNFDDTENLFIEGDNLEVLKLLQKSYYGKVKMIYIDPPYNTGNEFIYPDNYTESLDTYLSYAGLVDGEGKKFATNTATEGRFHTKWLNMMYPRLYLARNLLRDDGVVFVSVDDNELTNLRKLCDEVFGENNFVCQVIVRANSRGQTYNQIAKTHEYLLIYSKHDELELNELDKDAENDDLNLEDNIGRYNIRELRNRNPKFGRHNRPNLFYPIYVNPSIVDEDGFSPVSCTQGSGYNTKVEPFNSKGEESCWRWGRERLLQNISKNPKDSNLVARKKQDGAYSIFEKYRKTTYKPKSIWDDNMFLNETGTIELKVLGLGNVFDFPKPVDLVKRCIMLACDGNDIVLDFFAGSSVTAQAVLSCNEEDGGNRKFIMVQLPEPCDEKSEAYQAGYKTIADIGKERIRRVIKKIHDEQAAKKQKNESALPGMAQENSELDLGFRVLKLDKSNFKVWDGTNPNISVDQLKRQLELHLDHINPNSSQEDILFEILLKAGYMPTERIDTITLADKTVFSISNGSLLICLEDEITKEAIDEMAKAGPKQVICLDHAFQQNDQLKANAVQTFAMLNQDRETSEQIIFRTV